MTRADTTRTDLLAVIRVRPFRPFAVSLENGDRAIVEHPENVAFDPPEGGSRDVVILGHKMKILTTLDAITSIARVDHGV